MFCGKIMHHSEFSNSGTTYGFLFSCFSSSPMCTRTAYQVWAYNPDNKNILTSMHR
ncbi:hypothetical protein X975_19480, partial [Stegodyphus mimosarum]